MQPDLRTGNRKSPLPFFRPPLPRLPRNSGVGDLYHIYALAKRDGVRLQLAYIGDDFEQPHPVEFDRQYMVKLFEYGRAKARTGYPWRGAPPGF
jgi:hypothetical protein